MTKPKKPVKQKIEYKRRCHDCNLKAGATVPKFGPHCVTVCVRICDDCGKKTWIVPAADYNWPDGRKAVFD